MSWLKELVRTTTNDLQLQTKNKMEIDTIKFKTIQFVSGTRYLLKDQVEQVKNIMCYNLKIEKTEENLKAVEEGLKIYFATQNSLRLV